MDNYLYRMAPIKVTAENAPFIRSKRGRFDNFEEFWNCLSILLTWPTIRGYRATFSKKKNYIGCCYCCCFKRYIPHSLWIFLVEFQTDQSFDHHLCGPSASFLIRTRPLYNCKTASSSTWSAEFKWQKDLSCENVSGWKKNLAVSFQVGMGRTFSLSCSIWNHFSANWMEN